MDNVSEVISRCISNGDETPPRARILRDLEALAEKLKDLSLKHRLNASVAHLEESLDRLERTILGLERIPLRVAPSKPGVTEAPKKRIETMADLEAALTNGFAEA